MKREIKFRAWIKDLKELGEPKTLKEIYEFKMLSENSIFNDLELMQYTGLKDTNGVEIYEGDILKFGNNNTSEVTFENGCFNVFDEPLGWDFDSEEVPIKALMSYSKVIGNIHENPELL